MQFRRRFTGATLVAASLCLQQCAAQDPTMYTDAATGITFGTWGVDSSQPAPGSSAPPGAFRFGMALPADATTKDATEYVGMLRCTGGWCGISHGQYGQMTNSLLLMAWPNGNEVLTSFRFATGYNMPDVYNGDAKLTQISSKVNGSSFEVLYRCQGCFAWNHEGATGTVSTASGNLILGRAQAKAAVTNPSCPAKISFGYHNDGFAQWGAPLTNVISSDYAKWAALATKTVSGMCGDTTASPTATDAPTSTSSTAVATSTSTGKAAPTDCVKPPTNVNYDYVVVGAGAGGIPIADRLSEAGYDVLLIEKGPPSSGRYGGKMKPQWLEGTNLTRFDVPGLCNQIWVDSDGIACTDTDQMAGCVLGGGVAVNAGLWWKPNPTDWDLQFPKGWGNKDVAAATNRVFSRIPGTTVPSMDGKLYRQEGFNMLAAGLAKSGYKMLTNGNDHPNEKNQTFAHTTFMFSNGERGGPLATYLASAVKRKTFTLWTDTAVKKVIRTGARITGVEVECAGDHGHTGIVNVAPKVGRVILSAGTFGSAKILLRSGIGPADQLRVVQNSTDGASMIADNSWINLPVGYNLIDHVNTDVVIEHPDVVPYDFYEAWTTPNADDKSMYLDHRSGILATAAPNIGPMVWDEIKGKDGIVRQLQWTSRVEGSLGDTSPYAMTLSQYLGRGSTSRGRMTITPRLDTAVTTVPYLHDQNDVDAVVEGLEKMRNAIKGIANITFYQPPDNMTSVDYVKQYIVTAGARRANHWMGSAKMGTDDGRTGGTSVVDTNTKVYGTDNLFVVDASIFPGMSTGNPSAMIVIASEYAAEKISNLPYPAM